MKVIQTLMLKIKNLCYAYSNKTVLQNINITINENEIVGVIGGSGVGKTTLFNLIAGILKKQVGTIEMNASLCYMLQKDLLLEHKKVIDNIALPLIIDRVSKKTAYLEAKKLLKLINLENIAQLYPAQLSGGMRQRVAFLRTIMMNKKIMLLDESFSALDAITRKEMHAFYLKMHNEFNLTTLLITHDIEEALILCNKIYVLGKQPGEVVYCLDVKKSNTINAFITSNEFIIYKKKLLDILERY